MNEPHPDFQKSLALMTEQIEANQREFGFLISGKRHIENSVKYPKTPDEQTKIRAGVRALIEGSALVYLFAMWEAHTPEDMIEWLTADEKQRFNAYRHIRDSVAHGYKGSRADFPARKAAFEALMPFDGITWDQETDTIDISNACAAIRCHAFLQELGKQLVIRLHANKKPSD